VSKWVHRRIKESVVKHKTSLRLNQFSLELPPQGASYQRHRWADQLHLGSCQGSCNRGNLIQACCITGNNHYDSYKVFFLFVILCCKEIHKGVQLTSYQPAPTTGAHNLQSFIKPIESQQLILLMEFNAV
jgi:hypothetical protein